MLNNKLIDKISTYASIEKPSDDELLLLLVWVRLYLENNDLKQTYPILNFYCNWCLHPSLSQKNELGAIISKISKSLSNIDSHKSTIVAEIQIFRAIRLPEFIFQFENLLQKLSISLNSIKGKNLNIFIFQLFTDILIDRRLIFSKDKGVDYENISVLERISPLFGVKEISFHFEEFYGDVNDPNKSSYCLCCLTRSNCIFQIPLILNLWPVILNGNNLYDLD